MDFGNVAKPPVAVPIATLQRNEQAGPSRPVSQTDLPSSNAVTQVRDSASVLLDLSERAEQERAIVEAQQQQIRRETDIDEATRTVVVRSRDAVSGEVLDQTPPEALLNLRAYLRGSDPSR